MATCHECDRDLDVQDHHSECPVGHYEQLESLRAQLAAAQASEREQFERDGLRVLELEAKVSAYREFVVAFDAWAASDEHCGGDLFHEMLESRERLSGAEPAREGMAPAEIKRVEADENTGKHE